MANARLDREDTADHSALRRGGDWGLHYDKAFHASASGAMVLVAWEAMKRWAGAGPHLGGMLLMTWLVVMGGGAVVEVAELVGSVLSDVSVGGYLNNALDLVANATGATIVIGAVWRIESRAGPDLAMAGLRH